MEIKLPKHLAMFVDTPEKRMEAEYIMARGRERARQQGFGKKNTIKKR